ncbi:hypothetical protein F66182_14317 [Fusarium sp. NRRL 66182]|nr:hypothetical protein F66182_14317 [Fusarium sp. NRRL 66182]
MSQSFTKFWSTDLTRDSLLSLLDTSTLKSLRLVNHAFAATTSRQLFRDVSITFRSSTFTKPARMAALERIGWNIRTVTFVLNHGPEMFLPPLLDPLTGEELFAYRGKARGVWNMGNDRPASQAVPAFVSRGHERILVRGCIDAHARPATFESDLRRTRVHASLPSQRGRLCAFLAQDCD